jgi:hypothetical protein
MISYENANTDLHTFPNMQQNLELGMLCASLGIRAIQQSYLDPSAAAATMYTPLVLTT